MRKINVCALALLFLALCATPVFAAGFGISPSSIELDVPSNGQTQVEFTVHDFTGEIQIGLEDIPLVVSPTSVYIVPTNNKITLTFYGNGDLGNQTYDGKITFLVMAGGNVATGIKVKALINHNLIWEAKTVTVEPPASLPIISPIIYYVLIGILVIGCIVLVILIRKKRV